MRFADDNRHGDDDDDDDVSAPKQPEGDPRSFCSNQEKARQRGQGGFSFDLHLFWKIPTDWIYIYIYN